MSDTNTEVHAACAVTWPERFEPEFTVDSGDWAEVTRPGIGQTRLVLREGRGVNASRAVAQVTPRSGGSVDFWIANVEQTDDRTFIVTTEDGAGAPVDEPWFYFAVHRTAIVV